MDGFEMFEEPCERQVANGAELPVVIEVEEPEQGDKRKTVRHSVVFPSGVRRPEDPEDDVYRLRPPAEPARRYPFELDPF